MDSEAFAATVHGGIACATCHGGTEPAAGKEEAHHGVVADPDAASVCAPCHVENTTSFAGSMHANLWGERTMIATRTGMDDWHADPAMSAGFDASCNSCHATCGQCHISRPASVGGGFVDGHVFNRQPSMINQCVACHGSRVGEEFRGTHRDEIEGYQGDVHYLAGMRCEACHGAAEMHGGAAEHRYAVAEMPLCEDCHPSLEGANAYHGIHMDTLSCQVCHAQDYKQCASCHVPDGLDAPSELGFKIGLNPLPEHRPYTYVTLRHIPIAPDTYAGWGGPTELASYDALPTFKYTSPHNIQRWTARTLPVDGGTCADACHGSPSDASGWFLRQADLDRFPEEASANAPYAVPDGSPVHWAD